jgi:hypothetical protein
MSGSVLAQISCARLVPIHRIDSVEPRGACGARPVRARCRARSSPLHPRPGGGGPRARADRDGLPSRRPAPFQRREQWRHGADAHHCQPRARECAQPASPRAPSRGPARLARPGAPSGWSPRSSRPTAGAPRPTSRRSPRRTVRSVGGPERGRQRPPRVEGPAGRRGRAPSSSMWRSPAMTASPSRERCATVASPLLALPATTTKSSRPGCRLTPPSSSRCASSASSTTGGEHGELVHVDTAMAGPSLFF